MHEKMKLSTEGLCGNKMFTDWKLDLMAEKVFKTVSLNKDMIINEIFCILNSYSKRASNQSVIAKVHGRKGKGIVELDFHNENNKKDNPREENSSLGLSNYTYKSVDIKHFVVLF